MDDNLYDENMAYEAWRDQGEWEAIERVVQARLTRARQRAGRESRKVPTAEYRELAALCRQIDEALGGPTSGQDYSKRADAVLDELQKRGFEYSHDKRLLRLPGHSTVRSRYLPRKN